MDARVSKTDERDYAGHRARLRERLLEAGPDGFHDYELIEYLAHAHDPARRYQTSGEAADRRFRRDRATARRERRHLAA